MVYQSGIGVGYCKLGVSIRLIIFMLVSIQEVRLVGVRGCFRGFTRRAEGIMIVMFWSTRSLGKIVVGSGRSVGR